MNLKKLLAENMLRFGTKNLSYTSKQRLMEKVTEPAILKMMPDAQAAENYFLPKRLASDPGTGLVYNGTHFIYKVAASLTPQQLADNVPYSINAFGLRRTTIQGADNVKMEVLVAADMVNALAVQCDPSLGLISQAHSESPTSNANKYNIAIFRSGAEINIAYINKSFNIFTPEMITAMAKSSIYINYANNTKLKTNPVYATFSTQLTGNAKTFYDLLPGQAVPSPQKVVPKPVVPVKKP